MPLHDIAPASPLDGWLSDGATWTPASTTTFTVSGDQTAVFSKGTRLKLTQSATQKYLVVAASSHSAGTSTVTATGGADYSLHASDPITGNFFSYAVNPQGYPGIFTFVPTWTSTGTAPAIGNGILEGTFSVFGRDCFIEARLIPGSTTTFGTGDYTFALPINGTFGSPPLGTGMATDNSAGTYFSLTGRLPSASLVEFMRDNVSPSTRVSATNPFTWAQNDQLQWSIHVRI